MVLRLKPLKLVKNPNSNPSFFDSANLIVLRRLGIFSDHSFQPQSINLSIYFTTAVCVQISGGAIPLALKKGDLKISNLAYQN